MSVTLSTVILVSLRLRALLYHLSTDLYSAEVGFTAQPDNRASEVSSSELAMSTTATMPRLAITVPHREKVYSSYEPV
ncbi:hypothetical protein B6U99_07480 [Candidatus Geothermarchaeota archaeon ex4572_27]|nr:MAG: hypothetical protein B6U99_07480 [Candidatus Geothermarchaeota archaeon ex4572_27]